MSPGFTEADDSALVRRVQQGDRGAFDELTRRYMRRAYSVAFRMLEDRHDAEDLVQDAFIACLEGIDGFERGRPFAPWFFRILVNRGLNLRKARGLRRGEELPGQLRSRTESPARAAERAETRTRLAEAMEQLTARQRTVVQLFELEGFSGPEIAEILDLSPGTVRWHLHEARAALREALEESGGRTEAAPR